MEAIRNIYAGGKKDDKNYDVECYVIGVDGIARRTYVNVWAYNRNAAAACVKRLGHEVCSVNRVG